MTEHTVLVIDDDEDVARIMKEILTYAGYATLHAASASEAGRLLREHRPGLVVVEPYALGPDRWTRVAELAAGDAAEGPRNCLVVTTLALEAESVHAAGGPRYLAKPVSLQRVLKEIEGLLPLN
jgi:DNA-binding response OmpR family regulator